MRLNIETVMAVISLYFCFHFKVKVKVKVKIQDQIFVISSLCPFHIF